MKRLGLLMAVALVGCSPKYESGKTQCSDGKHECPSGYTCRVQGGKYLCFAGGGNGGAGGTGGRADAGAGGVGGIKPSGGGGLRGTGGAIRDAGLGGSGPKDALTATCPKPCPVGQQCFSGQCCPIPAAGGQCSHFPSCGCLPGEVCYPSASTHTMTCFVSDGLPAGADCTGSTCMAGFGCFGRICKAYCSKTQDCAAIRGYASCDQTTWSSDKTDIPGVKVCERICDPAHPQSPTAPLLPCPAGFNCSSDSSGIGFCFKASPLPPGSPCSAEKDCPAGHYCSKTSVCKRYCLSDADCAGGTTCRFGFDPPEYAADFIVGYCN